MIEIYIVAGFLGAGKTTYIKQLMAALPVEKTVILENEFGEVNIDGTLLRQGSYDVVEITSGCICCSLKAGFTQAILDISQRLQPDRIIIEPSGMGLLSGILEILNSPALQQLCTVRSVVTVIDGENYLEQEDVFGEFFKDQIVNGGLLFVSKTETIADTQAAEIRQSLRRLNEKAPILMGAPAGMDGSVLSLLMAASARQDIYMGSHHGGHEETEGIDAISIAAAPSYTRSEVEELLRSLQDRRLGCIYRVKGILSCEGKAVEFSFVNGHGSLAESEAQPMSRICLIGRDLHKGLIQEIFGAVR